MPEAIISLQQQQQSHDKRDLTIGLLLACWLVFSAVILGALSMSHVVAFPEPEESAIGGLIRDLNAMRRSSDGDFAVHVIAKDCSCTESLFRHLMKNGPADQAEELVLFVGEDEKKRRAALAAGYRYKSITQDDLTAMGLESAPVLALFDDKDEIHYLGGYYDHPSASNPLDQRLRAAIARGETADPLPIFGCAVSQRLKEAFDPYGMVYDS